MKNPNRLHFLQLIPTSIEDFEWEFKMEEYRYLAKTSPPPPEPVFRGGWADVIIGMEREEVEVM